MRIGIVVYSHTGNTMLVAEKLKARLDKAGHSAEIKEIGLAPGARPEDANPKLDNPPDLSKYDALVFGSPVHGFSLSKPMASYMNQLVSIKGKTTACFVTQKFPYAWLGGNRSVGQMSGLLTKKGAKVASVFVVNWAESKREKTTRAALDGIARVF